MNKKAQIVEIFGVLIIIGIAIFGVTQMYYQKSSLYVGDKIEFKAYKYSECIEYINSLPQERLIVFTSKELINQEYNLTSCN
tara:strand:+ start:1904 stop:2149 length:246 start_codon:yes stop_codon:yes gene_type:complete